VVMEVRPAPAVEVSDLGAFFRFVAGVFQLRRKQLRTSIARVIGAPPEETARRLGQLGVDPARRPETLSLAEWERVFSRLTA
jgi:16S rRNA A1518/A1519 N6-dimethyltransferase RsmA/KsgA/DIM1 with predicted DNA glycosylase/AP lyase activity